MGREKPLNPLDTCKARQFGKLRFAPQRSENMRNVFHAVIITVCILTLWGCGYKGDPYYQKADGCSMTF